MRGKFDRHLYCCTEADLAVRSESALPPPFFFVHYPLNELSQRLYLNTSDSARLCIPRGPLRLKLLQENHDCLMAGHPGRDRTYWNLSRHFYWPRMGREVKAFVRFCESCQRNKSGKIKVGLLQPLPIPDRPWAHISMDFIVGLPQTDLLIWASMQSSHSSTD